MFGWWMEWRPTRRTSVGEIALLAAWGVLLLALGALILMRPEVLAFLAAGVVAALGASALGVALAEAWAAWRRRPRQIKVRVVG